jgi:predicted nuclease of predicted toxin-antitoxin system
MRILLDEDLPRRLAKLLTGHEAETVPRCGWSGVKNGKLLALAATKFDVFLTMDQNIEFQQNLATLPIAILVVEAVSNRIEHLEPVVPEILRELNHIPPKSLRRVKRRPSGEA